MKLSKILPLCLALTLLATGNVLMAQEADETDVPGPEAPPAEEQEVVLPVEEEPLTYEDYNVKGYSLALWGGQYSGATYLENQPLDVRTILTDEEYAINGFDGNVLEVSLDADRYTGATKEIQTGPAMGGRIGIYISDNFHLDLMGTYAQSEVVTTMVFTPDPEFAPNSSSRVEVDRDTDFSMIKGGLALTYDAKPATFFGIMPRVGFGLGGIINSYSVLPDVTALYLEGNFSLNYDIIDDLALTAQIDVTNFAFEVDELGYSNMVNNYTYSLGLTWFIDVIPDDIRAAHEAEQD